MNNDYPGVMVVFEGPEGSGKTTMATNVKDLLVELLKSSEDVVLVRHPGATDLGTQLRNLLQHSDLDIHPFTEAYLLLADRTQTYYDIVLPAMQAGKIVLMDRYDVSLLAMQGAGKKEGRVYKLNLEAYAHLKSPEADLRVFISAPNEVLDQRMQQRVDGLDRLESMDRDSIDRMRECYHQALIHSIVDPTCIDVDTSHPTDGYVKTIVNSIISIRNRKMTRS